MNFLRSCAPLTCHDLSLSLCCIVNLTHLLSFALFRPLGSLSHFRLLHSTINPHHHTVPRASSHRLSSHALACHPFAISFHSGFVYFSIVHHSKLSSFPTFLLIHTSAIAEPFPRVQTKQYSTFHEIKICHVSLLYDGLFMHHSALCLTARAARKQHKFSPGSEFGCNDVCYRYGPQSGYHHRLI